MINAWNTETLWADKKWTPMLYLYLWFALFVLVLEKFRRVRIIVCTVYRRHLVEVDDYFLSMKWLRMILGKRVQCWYFLLTLTWPIVSNLFSFCRQTARCTYTLFRVAKGPPNYICLNPARVNKFAVLQIGFRRAKRSPKITLTRRRMTEGLKYHQAKKNLFPG